MENKIVGHYFERFDTTVQGVDIEGVEMDVDVTEEEFIDFLNGYYGIDREVAKELIEESIIVYDDDEMKKNEDFQDFMHEEHEDDAVNDYFENSDEDFMQDFERKSYCNKFREECDN